MPAESRPHGRSNMSDFAPYYDAAEALFHVHGARGEDPTEPPATRPYPASRR